MWGEAFPESPKAQSTILPRLTSKPPTFLISFWRRKVGRGRAHDRAPGVSAPPFLQELRLCGLYFPRTVLAAMGPQRFTRKGFAIITPRATRRNDSPIRRIDA